MQTTLVSLLVLFLITPIYSQTFPVGSFVFAGRTKQETRVVGFEKQIKALELIMDNAPQYSTFSMTLQNTTFGQVVLEIIRPGKTTIVQPRKHAAYTRVLKGSIDVSGRNVKYSLKMRDGILYGPGILFPATNDNKDYTTVIHVRSSSDNKLKVPISLPQPQKNEDISNDSKIGGFANVGRLFVYGKDEVNINAIAQRLMNQNVRLTSQLLAHERGMSAIMFVLKGVSGCHLHTKSDYMSWNGYGSAHHDMKLPNKFETGLNDVVLMPWKYEHNLVSDNNDFNVMVMVQYPEQLTSDSMSADGCT